MSFHSFQSVFKRVAAKYHLQGEFAASHIIHVYAQVVQDALGEDIASRTSAKYLKNQVLWVRVDGSSAAQKLQLSLHSILQKLQDTFGEKVIARIKIVQEKLPDDYAALDSA